MSESQAVQFFDEVVGDDEFSEDSYEEIVLESDRGRELTMEIHELERTYVIDKLNELPDSMLQGLDDVDDPEDIDEEEAAEAVGGLSGDAVRAFESLCAEALYHDEYTSHETKMLVKKLGLEVLFEIGGHVVELSLDESGKVTGFRKAD